MLTMPSEQSELDDAYSELERLGFDAGTFTFTRTPYKYQGTGPAPVIADMAVMNTATGKQITYDAGHGSSWPAQFSDDLRAGLFGPPSGR